MTGRRFQRQVDPGDYAHIVGRSFVQRARTPLLVIGALSWSRYQLGRLGCPHPVAAAHLNRVVQQLGITSLDQLAARANEIGTYNGLGVTAYWTMLAILREGGWQIADIHEQPVTYATVKARARKAERSHQRPRRRRKGHGS